MYFNFCVVREADVELYIKMSWADCSMDVLISKTASSQFMRNLSKGNFEVQKSVHALLTVAMDQAHEQMNNKIKGDGGAIGITDNPSALISG